MRLTDGLHRINLQEEVQEIYLHRFLFKLAIGLVSIFLPLYLLGHGYAVTAVFLFFSLYYGTFLVLVWPAAWLTGRIGYKHVSLLASPVIFLFYLSLRSVPHGSVLVYPVAVLGGAGFVMYWIGMNSEMALSSHDNRRERETGYFYAVPLLASVLSPFVGGIALSLYGFPMLLLLTAAIVAASFLPFLLSTEHTAGMETDIHEFMGRARRSDFATFLMQGVMSTGRKVVWPLFLALVIQESVAIGGAGSLIALGSAAASILLGRIVVPENRALTMCVGAAITATAFLAMATVTTAGAAFLVSFAAGVGYVAVNLPIYSAVMSEAEREDIIEYFAFREAGLCSGRILALIFFVAVFSVLRQAAAFPASFAFIAAGAVGAAWFGPRVGRA
ncbi:MAG: MFS transporter [Candidatus Nanohaloarchaea archaeon]|nr:MFS transporter [Candidatus Nanohaloarchaea archaeon]